LGLPGWPAGTRLNRGASESHHRGAWTGEMDLSEPLGIRIQSVVIDVHDPAAQARFWAEALGWRITFENDAESVLEPPEDSPAIDVAPDLLFGRVPEGKSLKNRLHFDLRPDDQQQQVDRLVELGGCAPTSGRPKMSDGSYWPIPRAMSSASCHRSHPARTPRPSPYQTSGRS
jgi:hypothetical protein